jgi:hypothetical protein
VTYPVTRIVTRTYARLSMDGSGAGWTGIAEILGF